MSSLKRINLESLADSFKETYSDTYDLSHLIPKGYDSKYRIEIGCKKHGWVKTNLYNFKKGKGCPICNKEKSNSLKYDTNSFCEKVKTIHGDYYDLSKVNYTGIKDKVTIICRKHGEFPIIAESLLKGCGCSQCSYDTLRKLNTKSQEQYIEDCKKVHGNKYIIDSSIGYINARHNVYPICPKHGKFSINASSFLSGCGCAECYGNKPLTTNEFIERSLKVHNNFYNYPQTTYINAWSKVKINCPVHGEFEQFPADHLSGKGCKKCAKQTSKPEEELYLFIKSEFPSLELFQNVRDLPFLNGKELDLYIPSKKMAIEYDGLVWHSDKFRGGPNNLIDKTIICENNEINLIHIFEDEWIEHKNLIKNQLRLLLDNTLINSNNYEIKQISSLLAKPFFSENHLLGFKNSTKYYGAFHENNLLSVISFKEINAGNWEMNQFALVPNNNKSDIFVKLFEKFINDNNIKTCQINIDRKWKQIQENTLNVLGFKLKNILPPKSFLIKGQKRFNEKLINIESNQTYKDLGYNKIWDCGTLEYIWGKNL